MFREKKIGRLAFRAHKTLLQAIEEKAKEYKTTMSDIIVQILSDALLPPSLPENDQYVDPLDAIDRLFDDMDSKASDAFHN